jgi:hypothetical protein
MEKLQSPPGDEPDPRMTTDESDRRQAMKKMGKLAAYTAPTLTVLLAEPDPLPGSSQP